MALGAVFNGAAILSKGRAVILGTGTKPRNFVAAQDVAEVAAQGEYRAASNRAAEK